MKKLWALAAILLCLFGFAACNSEITCKVTAVNVNLATKACSITVSADGNYYTLADPASTFTDMEYVSWEVIAYEDLSYYSDFVTAAVNKGKYILIEVTKDDEAYTIKMGPDMKFKYDITDGTLQIKFDTSYCNKK